MNSSNHLRLHAVFLPAITGKIYSAGQWTGHNSTFDTPGELIFSFALHHNHAPKNHSSYIALVEKMN